MLFSPFVLHELPGAFCLWSLSVSHKKHSPRPWHSLQTNSRCFSITYPLPLHTTQTISASWNTATMEPSKESLYRFWPIRQFYVVGKKKKTNQVILKKGQSFRWSVCPCYFWVFPWCRYFCLCLSITKRDRRDGKKDARTPGKPAPPQTFLFQINLSLS